MKRILLLASAFAVHSALAQLAPPVTVALGSCGLDSLQAPARIAIGPSGTIYIADPPARRVVVLDSVLRTLGAEAVIAQPLGMALDPQGRAFIADGTTRSVLVFDSAWKLLYKLGAGDGEFRLPNHIALWAGAPDPMVFVSDSEADEVKVFGGSSLVARFGTHGSGEGQFDFPTGICISPKGDVFVVDQNNDRVQVFDLQGRFARSFSLGGTAQSPSGRAQGAVLDAAGRLYVADSFQGVVKVFDAASGAILSNLGSFGCATGQLSSPAGVALDGFNRLFVSSAGAQRVEMYGLDSFLHLEMEPRSRLLAVGQTLVLRAITGGTQPYTFQWRKNGVDLQGATDAVLTVSQTTPSDGLDYSVAVTSAAGTQISGSARVQVLVPPTILSSPADLTVFSGSNVTFQVSTSGSTVQYQWRLNGVDIEGATDGSLFLNEVQPYQAGSYTVLVSNAVGCATSAPAQLTVLVPPAVVEIVAASMALNGQFHLTLNADPGFRYALEATDDFYIWGALTNLTYDADMVEVVDPGATNSGNRYYRFRWLP